MSNKEVESKKPLLLIANCSLIIEFVLPEGLEPSPAGPEPDVLSITLREQNYSYRSANLMKSFI